MTTTLDELVDKGDVQLGEDGTYYTINNIIIDTDTNLIIDGDQTLQNSSKITNNGTITNNGIIQFTIDVDTSYTGNPIINTSGEIQINNDITYGTLRNIMKDANGKISSYDLENICEIKLTKDRSINGDINITNIIFNTNEFVYYVENATLTNNGQIIINKVNGKKGELQNNGTIINNGKISIYGNLLSTGFQNNQIYNYGIIQFISYIDPYIIILIINNGEIQINNDITYETLGGMIRDTPYGYGIISSYNPENICKVKSTGSDYSSGDLTINNIILDITGKFSNVYIKNNGTITINDKGELVNMVNGGGIENNGKIKVNNGGKITNNASIDNNGTIYNNGTIECSSSGTIEGNNITGSGSCSGCEACPKKFYWAFNNSNGCKRKCYY